MASHNILRWRHPVLLLNAHQSMHDPMTVSAKALQVLQARLMAIHHVLHLNAAVMHFNAGFPSFTVRGNWVHPTALTS